MANPYQAPASRPVINETYLPRFLSLKGRIGRLRYLAYGLGIALLAQVVLLPAFMLAAGAGSGVPAEVAAALPLILFAIVYLAVLVFTFGFLVRRLNDIGATGWLSLLVLVPVVNLILLLVALFAPGTNGSNRYGPAPAPNSTVVVVVAWLVLIVFVTFVAIILALPGLMGHV